MFLSHIGSLSFLIISHTLVSRISQLRNCLNHRHILYDMPMVWTYSTLAKLWFCNLRLESTKKLLTMKFFWDRKLNFQNHLFLLPAPDVTQYVNLIHIFSIFILVSKFFPCGGLLRHSSLIHNLALPPRRVYQSNMTILDSHFFIPMVFTKVYPCGRLLGCSPDSDLVFLL